MYIQCVLYTCIHIMYMHVYLLAKKGFLYATVYYGSGARVLIASVAGAYIIILYPPRHHKVYPTCAHTFKPRDR